MKVSLQSGPTSYYPGTHLRIFLLLGFLYLSGAGWLRMSAALNNRDLLTQFGAQPGPLYLILSGAAWGLLGLAAAALTFVRRLALRRVVFGLALVFVLSYWLDFFLFTHSADELITWPFSLGVTVLGLVYTAWAMKIDHKERE